MIDWEPEPEPRPRRLALWAVLALSLAGLLVAYPLITNLNSAAGLSDPAMFPAAMPARARIALIEKQTSELRTLKALHPVKIMLLKNAAFSKRISGLLNSGLTKRGININDQEWVLSGLIPPSTNLRKVLTSGVASQVAGWYAYKSKVLYVRDSGQALGIDRWYVAHEYTHALQDQHFNLRRLEPDETRWKIHNSDQQLAVHSLVEGDAVTIQYGYVGRYYSTSEQRALFKEQQSIKSQPLPRAIQEEFVFPYTQGPAYVRSLLLAGGYSRVNKSFHRPPQSSFQLLFPGHSESVVAVHLDAALGPFRAWKVLDDDVNGAFGYQQLVEAFTSKDSGAALARLWRGDRYILLGNQGRYAMLMESVYDSMAQAARALVILRGALAKRFGGLYPDGVSQWGGRRGVFGAIRRSKNKVWIAFARKGSIARGLVVTPAR